MVRLFGHFWKRHAGVLLLWSVVVGLGTLALAAWGWIGWGLQEQWRAQWRQLRLQVFCLEESTPRVVQFLKRSGLVEEITVVSPAEGWQLVHRILGMEGNGADTLLPAVVSVSLRQRLLPERLGELYAQLQQVEGVSAVDFPWARFSDLLWQRALIQVGWYGCGGGVGLLWLASAGLVGRELRRRLEEYRVLVLLGISPWRLRLPMALGVFSAVGLGVSIAAGVAGGLWFWLQLNFSGHLSDPWSMVYAEPVWLGIATVNWLFLLVLLPSIALGGRLTS